MTPPGTLTREFLREQLPVIASLVVLGIVAAFVQHGFLPGGDAEFPLAGVRVPLWHLFWMGFWTGYTMALVGEAAGIFALPYSMSVLQFSGLHVTPTIQLVTLLNPLGALFGYRRNRQWHPGFALWACLGGVAGGLVGPFLRLELLSDAEPFRLAVGVALAVAGIHLCTAAWRGFSTRRRPEGIERKFAAQAAARKAAGLSPAGIPTGVGIETVARARGKLTIGYWGESWTVDLRFLFVTGFLVGTVSAALGVGGGFLLVPILSICYGLPMYVLVAATIPYVIVLSAISLLTYAAIVPAVTGLLIPPEWTWGLLVAAGGVLGSWCAAKTQRYVPEHFLKLMLGGVTGLAGALYVVSFFYSLPFRL